MTSAIDRLTAHAERASSLMADSASTDLKAGPILDNYESALTRFKAGLSEVNEKTKALEKALPALGNAAQIIGTAFQDEKPPAAETSTVNGQQPADKANHPMPPGSP